MATKSNFQKFWRPLIKFAILQIRYCVSTPSSRDQIRQNSNRKNEISPDKVPRERSIVRNRGVLTNTKTRGPRLR